MQPLTTGSTTLDQLIAEGRVRVRHGPAFDEIPWRDHQPSADRWRGMLIGQAVGDALGNTSESLNPSRRYRLHGEITHYLPNLRASLRRVGLPSDDTQLSAWAVEQIVRDGHFSVEAWLSLILPRRIFGGGRTVSAALASLSRGTAWPEASQRAAGNGALMRCPGVFVAHLGSHGRYLPADAALFAAATHNDYAATSSAVAFSLMLAELLTMAAPPHPSWWLERFVELAAPLEGETQYEGRGAQAAIGYKGPIWKFVADRVASGLASDHSTAEICDWWFSGAYLLETLPSVLLILARYATDPDAAILRAVNDTRDNDTVAAVVGSAMGALYGEAAIRDEWRRDLLGRTMADDDGALFRLLDSAELLIAQNARSTDTP